MKKKKNPFQEKMTHQDVLLDQDRVTINQSEDITYFQIGYQITDDLAEAVSIMMRIINENDPIWNIKIKNKHDIDYKKSLYWLSGGDEEWVNLPHYNQSWIDCNDLYVEEFKQEIENIINESVTFKDIKQKFKSKLNMFKMYDFAIANNLIK
jgi:hypothetical protein